jgi:hypothetical protein
MVEDAPSVPQKHGDRRWVASLARWAAIPTGLIAGLALFLTNVASIKDTAQNLLGVGGQRFADFAIRDVRADESYAVEPNIHVTVEAVVDKKGIGAGVCEPGLLMKNSEFSSFGFRMGAYRRTAEYLPDSWTTMADAIKFNDDFRQGIVEFYFAIGRRDFEKTAKFRLDCGSSVTPWASVEFSDPITRDNQVPQTPKCKQGDCSLYTREPDTVSAPDRN